MKVQNHKIGCFIVSRTSSKRLPNKVLKLVRGKSIIQHIIERAKLVSGVDIIVLCTSTDKSDDVLESVAKRNNIKVKFNVGASKLWSSSDFLEAWVAFRMNDKESIERIKEFYKLSYWGLKKTK